MSEKADHIFQYFVMKGKQIMRRRKKVTAKQMMKTAGSLICMTALMMGGMPSVMAASENENVNGGVLTYEEADELLSQTAGKSLSQIVLEYGVSNYSYDTIGLCGGNSHMQGICVDDNMEYLYFSYTSSLAKVDMKTGEVVGSVGGFGEGSFGTPGGAHLGDLAYYDGKIYGSLEYKEPGKKFFIAAFDEDYITETGIDMKDMPEGVDGILLKEPTEDFRDPLNDYDEIIATNTTETEKSDGFAENEQNLGHKLGCSGIDGVAFGNMPGDDSGKNYMFVAYGIYGWEDRYDTNYNVIQVYDPEDFHTEESRGKCLRRFTYERGISSDVDMEGDEYLEACDTLYVWTGTTNYGCQNLDVDRDTGDLVLYTYENTKDGWTDRTLYVIDHTKEPVLEELEVGQSNTGNNQEALEKAESYKIDTDNDGTADSYPTIKRALLKCVCGNDCQEQEWSDTGKTAMICGATIPGKATYGITSLDNGYYLVSNGETGADLYRRDENYNYTRMTVSAALEQAIMDAGKLEKTKYTDESWEAVQNAVNAAATLKETQETQAKETMIKNSADAASVIAQLNAALSQFSTENK